MKKKNLLLMRQLLTLLSIIVAAGIIIVALGFMTNFHVLLYDGNSDMYNFYKNIQALNHVLFSTSIVVLVYAALLLAFDVKSENFGLLGMIYVPIGTIVTVVKSFTLFTYIPHFKALYNSFDFSILNNYVPSPWIFDLTTGLFVIWDIISILLLITCVINYNLKYKEFKKQEMTRSVNYG